MTIEVYEATAANPASLDNWREIIARIVVPLDLRPIDSSDPERMPGRVQHAEVEGLRMAMKAGPPVLVTRRPSLIRNGDAGVLQVEIYTRGTSVVRQGERVIVARPGTVAMIDTSRPYEIGHSALSGLAQSLSVLVPRDALAPRDANRWPDALGDPARTRPVAAVAQEMWECLQGGEAVAAARLGSVFLELLRIGPSDRAGDDSPDRQELLRWRVRRFIDNHLADPGLAPATIAAAHHMSVRQLYRVFAAEEAGVAELVRSRRLARCRDDLADPRLQHLSIAAVCGRWGFQDVAHFTRLFGATYGRPPATFRAASLAIPRPRPGSAPVRLDG